MNWEIFQPQSYMTSRMCFLAGSSITATAMVASAPMALVGMAIFLLDADSVHDPNASPLLLKRVMRTSTEYSS